MDLGTIKKKLNKKEYWDGEECITDFRQVFKNCYTYNCPADMNPDTPLPVSAACNTGFSDAVPGCGCHVPKT